MALCRIEFVVTKRGQTNRLGTLIHGLCAVSAAVILRHAYIFRGDRHGQILLITPLLPL